jgi:NADH-quinone oxidoreductase subunit C
MDEHLQSAINVLVERLGAHSSEFRDQTSLTLTPETMVESCRVLRDEFHFEVLADETAVDYWPQETPRFHIVYILRSLQHNLLLSLRVHLDGNAPSIPTLEGVYPNANWHEREMWDMFGIHFDGHSDLRRILMPYEWEGYPLRKDFPLGYEEVQFSFNYDEIDVRKPYAKE